LERIFSFIASEIDLLNFRLVNHVFLEEATRRLRVVQKPIVLNNESQMEKFLCQIINRASLRQTPFPFVSFQIHLLELRQEILENFAKVVGQHIIRYFLDKGPPRSNLFNEFGGKASVLLSHSAQISELNMSTDLIVSRGDLTYFPTTFPNLRGLSISNKVHYYDPPMGNGLSLIELVVGRSANLQRVSIPPNQPRISVRVLQFIAQNRPNNLPFFYFSDCIRVNFYTIHLIQKLIELGLKFKNISLYLNARNALEAQEYVTAVGSWLERQSDSLTTLDITTYMKFSFAAIIVLPSLQVLKKLSLHFPVRGTTYRPRPYLPFVGNPFPCLEKLELSGYHEDFEMFGSCSLPSVLELVLVKP